MGALPHSVVSEGRGGLGPPLPPSTMEKLMPEISDTIARTMAVAVEGCCENASWRGRFCDFHRGMKAGLEMALATMDKAIDQRYPPAHIDGPGSPQWEAECEEFGCHDPDHSSR